MSFASGCRVMYDCTNGSSGKVSFFGRCPLTKGSGGHLQRGQSSVALAAESPCRGSRTGGIQHCSYSTFGDSSSHANGEAIQAPASESGRRASGELGGWGAYRVTASSHLGCSMTPASTRACVRTSIRRSVFESWDDGAVIKTYVALHQMTTILPLMHIPP